MTILSSQQIQEIKQELNQSTAWTPRDFQMADLCKTALHYMEMVNNALIYPNDEKKTSNDECRCNNKCENRTGVYTCSKCGHFAYIELLGSDKCPKCNITMQKEKPRQEHNPDHNQIISVQNRVEMCDKEIRQLRWELKNMREGKI